MSFTFSAAVRANKPRRNVALVSAGLESLIIAKNGRAWGWGLNSTGQVGNSSGGQVSAPVTVLGTVKTFCKISVGGASVGGGHTLAIDKNGRAWAWGLNSNVQLGDGTSTWRYTPVSVTGVVKTFCEISAGKELHSLALDKYGRAWSWGWNVNGQLGDGTTASKRTPVSVVGAIKTFCKISAGGNFSTTIDQYGRAWTWGRNDSSQLGNGGVGTQQTSPVSVTGTIKTFCEINAGNRHVLVIDKNGRAWGWGLNSSGQIGDNSITARATPVSVAGAVKTFCKISAGNSHSLAIDKNGRAWGWGYNTFGIIGDNTTVSKRTPVSIAGAIKTFCEIAAGSTHSLAIDKNGRAWGWGRNDFVQLGIDSVPNRCTPVSVVGGTKTFCELSSGSIHNLVIDKNGRVWAWGFNSTYQLGDGTSIMQATPVSVAGAVKTFCKIDGGANGSHSLAIDKNGRAWAWGFNSIYQLGDGTQTARCTPVSVAGAVKTFCEIAGGETTSGALDKNGRAWAWGLNNSYQVGDGTVVNRCTPVSVVGAIKTFCKISFGSSHALVIDKNGRLWAWGRNANGQAGTGVGPNTTTPTSVLGTLKTFCQISGGRLHSLAIDKNGRAWGWGYNNSGQVGNNTVTQANTPVSILGTIKTFCQISGGSNHSAAIDKNGRLWTWGLNSAGQLGDGSRTSRRTPVSVIGTVKTFCKIHAAGNYSTAIDKYGKAWGWGYNLYPTIGHNIFGYHQTPIRICNI